MSNLKSVKNLFDEMHAREKCFYLESNDHRQQPPVTFLSTTKDHGS